MIKHSFLKRELPNNLDGSENDQIKIRWIEDYTMPPPGREFTPFDNDKAGGSEAKCHCVKSVQIRNFFCSVFSCIRTEYGQKQLCIWTLFTQCVGGSILTEPETMEI